MKTCFKCKTAKASKQFYAHPRTADKTLNKCKRCTKEDMTRHREDNPVSYHERYKKTVPARDALLYNLLPGERDKMRAFQNNTDPISGKPLKPNANLDHCHKSGKLRGLLNPLSNRFLVDDLDRLKKMQAYIENPPAPLALGEVVYGVIGKAQKKKKILYGPHGSSTARPRINKEAQ